MLQNYQGKSLKRIKWAMDFVGVFLNTNTVLILLGVGTVIWAVRQVIPVRVEKSRVWKIVLRILPIGLGVAFSMIPALSPMSDLTQSAVIGGVAGSLSSNTYGMVRELFGGRVKLLLGAKSIRKSMGGE